MNMKYIKLICMIVIQLCLLSFIVLAEEGLPKIEEVEYIWIEPQEEQSNEFYTEESLLEALPNFRKIHIKSLGFGKVWDWQKGIIVLKNSEQLNWRAFTKNIILFETKNDAVFYSDIVSQTYNSETGYISRWVMTSNGPEQIIIELE